MQAYKLKGTIDQTGHLIVNEPIDLQPGEVEIIVLQSVQPIEREEVTKTNSQAEVPQRTHHYKTKALKEWFEKTQPAPPDFDAEAARWEALKEKYELLKFYSIPTY
jgi:hypothetical protein